MKDIAELTRLEGRVALVTGGAGHIGSVMADAFAECGARPVILDLRSETATTTAEDIAARRGVEALGLGVDLADETSVRSVPDRIIDHFGRLDVLVNCAALGGTSELKGWAVPFLQQSSDSWRMALEVNLTAPFVLTQVCAPALGDSGHGSVINIGSIYGISGPDMRLYGEVPTLGNPAAYAASKGGLTQLTRWLATVLAPKVRSNAISVGGVWRHHAEDFVDRYASRTPLGRMATEEDLKGAAVYLASDLSAYVTGHNLVVDGGWTAW